MKEHNKEFEAVRALEDGDLVAVHGRVRLTPSSLSIDGIGRKRPLRPPSGFACSSQGATGGEA
jgi:hypothetical protein